MGSPLGRGSDKPSICMCIAQPSVNRPIFAERHHIQSHWTLGCILHRFRVLSRDDSCCYLLTDFLGDVDWREL